MEPTPSIEAPLNVETYTKQYFKDIPIMAKIAECESGYRQFDSKGNVLRGVVDASDTGIMQINQRYHLADSKRLGYDIFTLEGNLAYARHLYKTQGVNPWLASRDCWSK